MENCKICDSSSNLIVHHLDCNKKNNRNDNSIILCNQCHNNIHQRGYNFRKTSWSINVSEYFTSIQGEGNTIGMPTHFFVYWL